MFDSISGRKSRRRESVRGILGRQPETTFQGCARIFHLLAVNGARDTELAFGLSDRLDQLPRTQERRYNPESLLDSLIGGE
jgi:hypothetical protein